ncbi:MAG: hypothetical protein QF724_13795, partial [Planctomycetota bacterium]|nr:hypothetical protein [Planctomycetota bacterium]
MRAARLFALSALALSTLASSPLTARPVSQEGPLANDTFLPGHGEASAAFERGDELYRAQAAAPTHSRSELESTFDAWRAAVLASPTGAAVPPPRPAELPGLPPRHSLGVEEALLLRLEGLTGAELAIFSSRFRELARGALRSALGSQGPAADESQQRDFPALAALEREYPATAAACRAALALADHALERGRPSAAGTWLGRASRHLALVSKAERADLEGTATQDPTDKAEEGSSLFSTGALESALERRREHLAELTPPAPGPAWAKASSLAASATRPLTSSRTRGMRQLPIRSNVQPGLTVLGDGSLVVQARGQVFVFPAGRRPFVMEPWKFIGGQSSPPPPESGSASSGRWPLYPLDLGAATDPRSQGRQRALLVCGRSSANSDNCLVAIEFSALMPVGLPLWTFASTQTPDKGGHSTTDALGPGRWEWEPGPIVLDELVLVQARQAASGDGSASVKSHLVALERDTGALIWQRFLA